MAFVSRRPCARDTTRKILEKHGFTIIRVSQPYRTEDGLFINIFYEGEAK